ncbi:hypothetical protein LP52_20540 [Streptomonospora alba]|uniref:DUF6504 domain-containing protein n=1 Tax=Streptomonospora alba TaxID=183763 RepID=A0A0C2FD80_9ACTN|nr:DUF6504 family protein [Streptomonospora alba]KIH97114.1 hypothetical protein LP52_20540 [Streptomonospora alba]
MSLYNERIDVRSTTGGHPAFFAWRDRTYRVRRVIGSWCSPGEPASRGRGARATATEVRLVRVAAESPEGEHSIADITCDGASGNWTMRRLWD